MFRHFVPSRELHSLATLVRLSLVDLPSANSMKCCSPPASLKNRIPKIRPLTGRNVRKVDGLFLSPKSKKEVNHNDKTKNPCPTVRKQIGKTTYIVRVHFSETAKETMEDKIKRMLREEVRKM